MSKVIQIRGVPDEVHDALVRAASDEGLSLTRFASRELARIARRSETARANAETFRRTQRAVGGHASRADILTALDEGRDP